MSIFFNEDASDRTGAIEGIPEKNLDGASDAIVGDQLAKKLTSDELKTFASSEEAKELIAKEIIEEETVEAMQFTDDDEEMKKIAALNIAKNEKDPRFEEAVKKKQETDEIIDAIVQDNAEEAEAVVESMKRNILPQVTVLRERMNL